MWVPNHESWHESHTDLSKYFIEKIKQQVDPTEIISNKHRTTNGVVLIYEIITLIELSIKNDKYKNRLKTLLAESVAKEIKNNIVNDLILKRHFPDIVQYYRNLHADDYTTKEALSRTLIRCEIHLKRVQNHYGNLINSELSKINFTSADFIKEATKINKLIDCLVPFLLFIGYSTTSISSISYRYITKDNGTSAPERILKNFTGKENNFNFLFITYRDSDEFKNFTTILRALEIKFSTRSRAEVEKCTRPDFRDDNDNIYLEIEYKCLDPHTFCRNMYDLSLKNYAYSKDRLTLHHFNDFFDRFFWRFGGKVGKIHLYEACHVHLDPINVIERRSTLRYTLEKFISKFNNESTIPPIEALTEPIYFYNLALGSKSIENSLSLLWTALEILLPYKKKGNDIENAQYFMSKYLSIGSIQRQLVSFLERLHATNNVHERNLLVEVTGQKYLYYDSNTLHKWAEWLCKKYEANDPNDPYESLKPISNLLCMQFTNLNDLYSGSNGLKVEHWIEQIKSSESSILHQLDRIYLHRNQIVHTGALINEYSNLWSHLEWYVGKILSYLVLKHIDGLWEDDYRDALLQLEADNEQIMTLLQLGKDKTITELSKETVAFSLIFEHSWQSF